MTEINRLVCLILCALFLFLSSEGSITVDYRYNQCLPVNCGQGPNISFPFFIPGLRHHYCGYPGFGIVTCNSLGFPVLNYSGIQYIIEDINYRKRSLRVNDSAVLSNTNSICLIAFRNISSPPWQNHNLHYAQNVRNLHLFSNCSNSLPGAFRVACDAEGNGDNSVRGLYEGDCNFNDAVGNCSRNIKVPVEENGEMGNVEEVLKRGVMMNWNASDCNDCVISGGHCGFNETIYQFQCFCSDRPHSRSCKNGPTGATETRPTVIVVLAISGSIIFLIVAVFVWYIIWNRKGRRNSIKLLKRCITKPDIEAGGHYFGVPIFSYDELEGATGSFDSSNEVGDGGFGTVYYGKLKDGREVAVKRLYEHNSRRMEHYMNEIKILTALKHQNLVMLYGCTSRRSKELLLVYEYVPNGTVACHLHGERAKNSPLSWLVRLRIAVETAGALSYLHKSDIIHRDVKTDNILLDSNFCVKVADFGLSRMFPNDLTHVSTNPQGTPGYVDPEYHQFYRLTDKSDVYSFGVVLVELVSSLPAVDIGRCSHEINLANLAVNKIQTCAFDELIDKSLGYETDTEVRWMSIAVAELAFRCLQADKEMRPSMDEVFNTLKEIQRGEKINKGSGTIPISPETDAVILLKTKKFESSPNAVIDRWLTSSTVRSFSQ